MRSGSLGRLMAAALIGLIGLGCNGQAPPPDEEELVIVPPGKEDNFFSNVAREYEATAQVDLLLDASYGDRTEEERMQRARRLMEGKTKQITWFLHLYLVDKHGEEEAAEYGGLRAMVLDGSFESDGLKADPEDPLKFTYTYKIQVGGTRSLLSKIRADKNLPADADTFPLEMAKLSNSRVASFSHSSFGAGDWSPETCECELETVDVKLEPIDESRDAYVDYSGFLDDGVLDVSVHVGWDYHARYDITHSRQLYNWLVDVMEFESPVSSYEEYNRTSGPLTRTITINGEEVLARVAIFRPDPCESWDEDGHWGSWAQAVEEDENAKKRSCPDWEWDNPEANANPTTHTGASHLMADLKSSLKTRDAIIFTGHSGYTYAYALASWYQTSAGDLDPPEIKALDLPADKSQLFVMSGCDTYHVAQAFKDNPNKLGLSNADVITTTSFSNAGSVSDTKDIITALVGSSSGELKAESYGKLMQSLNPTSYDYGHFFTMYGVHGIDDNPLANPLGDPSASCAACEKNADCGAAGNVCVRLNDNEKVCAQECLHDDGCAEGQICQHFGGATSGYLKGMACVPKNLTCAVEPPPAPETQEFTASGTVERGDEKRFTVPVGTGATDIEVVMTGSKDADLYTSFDAAPTKSDYACRPYRAGSSETCSHERSQGATLEIMVRGYAWGSSDFQLKVTWK